MWPHHTDSLPLAFRATRNAEAKPCSLNTGRRLMADSKHKVCESDGVRPMSQRPEEHAPCPEHPGQPVALVPHAPLRISHERNMLFSPNVMISLAY